ncbi:hypothetical protein ETN89_13755 [Photobacterium damselae subsp. damselae]|uniref:Uncharacterized protein n=1 Tax=Photobacterium damselae TaxID=38293 RepID=A0ACD3T5Z5_PHODM|nr:hypothetical protein [Photobacterium damselae]ARR49167.1 hypothetical protein CAY62_06005 [Photobacterium damselae subsp. damselae]ODA22225.1 hypothetical protein A0J46_07925 [Photobacterium damselae subsp. damselae]QAY36281.1 hypothetical protein ETN89_13755 [Photobacterium damselae subsp. damselae]RDL29010.1 hypothetical protein BC461_01405 [Photobacterium damselae]TMX49019.1 hypothetical protein DA099_11290 [Photobacterium damselae]
MKNLTLVGTLFLTLATLSIQVRADEQRIEAYRAAFHVGETVMACGVVADVHKGRKATYLNLDEPFPNQSLAVLIWDNKLSGFENRFGQLTRFNGEKVCVRGKIVEYKNSLQMQVSNPQFLRLMK